jgi:hypothetical protein
LKRVKETKKEKGERERERERQREIFIMVRLEGREHLQMFIRRKKGKMREHKEVSGLSQWT